MAPLPGKSQLLHFVSQATVLPWEQGACEALPQVQAALATAKARHPALAAVDPVDAANHPRMLQVTAFVCHAGYGNQNGFGFSKEDLDAAVENGLFAAPYFGMLDRNHDFNGYGVWYDAEVAWDPKAGAYGLLAKGALFAWRFEELANQLIANQTREGSIPVSVAILFRESVPRRSEDGRSKWMEVKSPVFLAISVLDEPPADPFGRGLVAEAPEDVTPEQMSQLLRASLRGGKDNLMEEIPMDELLAKIEAALGAQTEGLKELLASALKVPGLETLLNKALEARTKAEEDLALARKSEEELTARVAQLETELKASEVTVATLKDRLVSLEETNADLASYKETKEAEIAAAEASKRCEARRAQIPAVVMATIEKRPDKEAFLSELFAQSDEQWTRTVTVWEESIASATPKDTFVARSRREGPVSSATDPAAGGFAISRHLSR